MAVAHVKLLRRIGHVPAALLHGSHQCDHILELAAVSARVHISRAAHGAGNARGKFQPVRPWSAAGPAQFLQGRARLRRDGKAAVRRGAGSLTSEKRSPMWMTSPRMPPSLTSRLEPLPISVTGTFSSRAA